MFSETSSNIFNLIICREYLNYQQIGSQNVLEVTRQNLFTVDEQILVSTSFLLHNSNNKFQKKKKQTITVEFSHADRN